MDIKDVKTADPNDTCNKDVRKARITETKHMQFHFICYNAEIALLNTNLYSIIHNVGNA